MSSVWSVSRYADSPAPPNDAFASPEGNSNTRFGSPESFVAILRSIWFAALCTVVSGTSRCLLVKVHDESHAPVAALDTELPETGD